MEGTAWSLSACYDASWSGLFISHLGTRNVIMPALLGNIEDGLDNSLKVSRVAHGTWCCHVLLLIFLGIDLSCFLGIPRKGKFHFSCRRHSFQDKVNVEIYRK